jgi:hypothetical protein
MARIPTVEITVDGRKKIVNADDPRAQAKPAPKPAPKKRGRPKKAES